MIQRAQKPPKMQLTVSESLSPERRLIAGILSQAWKDLSERAKSQAGQRRRADAMSFWRNENGMLGYWDQREHAPAGPS